VHETDATALLSRGALLILPTSRERGEFSAAAQRMFEPDRTVFSIEPSAVLGVARNLGG
jgi:hypothetical protein